MKSTALALGLVSLLLFGCIGGATPWMKVGDNGILQVSSERGAVSATELVLKDTPELTLSKVSYPSLDGHVIVGLLAIPKANGVPVRNAPAAVYQPGAQVTKEAGNRAVAKALVKAGFIVLTLDARGVGETGGEIPGLDAEYAAFLNGSLSQEHLGVYDYLRAFDYLRSRPEVDSSRILFAGESNGGRVAIMAAAIEPRAKAILVVSTAGYHVNPPLDLSQAKFLRSLDADSYVGLIAPREIVFMHSPNDNGIPIDSARLTFQKASEPKQFIEVNCPEHGYCDGIEGLVGSTAQALVK